MSTAPAATTAATYTIDPAHSGAGLKIKHLMVAYVRGGFGRVTGDVIFDPTNPANSKIQASIDATTLHTHDEKRDAHVKGADFLDTAKYPTITFVSKKVTPDGNNRWKIVGDLTLHGVTKEVTLNVESAGAEAKDPWGNLRTGAEATTVLKRRCFLPNRGSCKTDRITDDSHTIAIFIRRKFNQKIPCSNLWVMKDFIKRINRARRNLCSLELL